MSNILISYARKDLEKVRQLAAALEAQGWSVFWFRLGRALLRQATIPVPVAKETL